MGEIDAALGRLGTDPGPDTLGELEARVLAHVAAAPAERPRLRVEPLVVGAALIMGMVGAGSTNSPAAAELSLFPLGGNAAIVSLAGEP